MGNVLATAADFVQKTANRVMKAIGNVGSDQRKQPWHS